MEKGKKYLMKVMQVMVMTKNWLNTRCVQHDASRNFIAYQDYNRSVCYFRPLTVVGAGPNNPAQSVCPSVFNKSCHTVIFLIFASSLPEVSLEKLCFPIFAKKCVGPKMGP